MEYVSVAIIAKKWNMSERSVRNYCALGRIDGAILIGKTWSIPIDTKKPLRINKKQEEKRTLLEVLRQEKNIKLSGGIYHKIQIELTYNSNHIEGSKLTHEQTRFIYETNTIGIENQVIKVDDILETINHFKCVDLIIEKASLPLSETLIKQLHLILKSGTSDSRLSWFNVGEYKKIPNEIANKETTLPKDVAKEMKKLINEYNNKDCKTFKDILDFHYKFECIHPFQDGNGRVGRLILFKECLKNNIVPFIIDDNLKMYYYRELNEWKDQQGYLIDTCLSAQDKFKQWLDYFNIQY